MSKPKSKPLTSAEKQARRLALLNDAARKAGYAGWRAYETEVVNKRVQIAKEKGVFHGQRMGL